MNSKFRIEYLPIAEKDLTEIVEYIRIDNPTAALNLLDTIDKAISKLAYFPYMGHAPKDQRLIRLNYRMLVVENYLVFYVVQDDVVEIRKSKPNSPLISPFGSIIPKSIFMLLSNSCPNLISSIFLENTPPFLDFYIIPLYHFLGSEYPKFLSAWMRVILHRFRVTSPGFPTCHVASILAKCRESRVRRWVDS